MDSLHVIIDDNDDRGRINYVGDWFLDRGTHETDGNFGPTFNHTLHGTRSSGSFSFTFNGTSFSVNGLSNFHNDSGLIYPKWECHVDNDKLPPSNPFGAAENNWVLCSQNFIPDGRHTVTVNVTTIDVDFWFDYALYTPSPGISLASETLRIEKSHPNITYSSSGWSSIGQVNITAVPNSFAQVHFEGTSLTWRGWFITEMSHNDSNATYTIDDGIPMPFVLHGPPTNDSQTLYNMIYLDLLNLDPGPHTLKITYLGPQAPLTIDYIDISPNHPPSQTTSLPSTASSSKPLSTSGATPSTIPHQDRSSLVGTIVASIGGTLATIMLLTLIFLLCRRRRARNQTHSELHPCNRGPDIYPSYANSSTIPETVSYGMTLPTIPEYDTADRSLSSYLPVSPEDDRPPAYTAKQ
ncbi:hypothetical protein AMATHDRAFT_55309 [Amanita thiersii Skay4041]|uniref:Uncharacterized protein n=1 Tax=Amanita thiersii Skay4041 TaxID=703135 RepID=A0A2A9NZG2_9AGAR|nr:hypothetical protein AMATHDRAFT_55309 [Amanita thiersii Skay4041]